MYINTKEAACVPLKLVRKWPQIMPGCYGEFDRIEKDLGTQSTDVTSFLLAGAYLFDKAKLHTDKEILCFDACCRWRKDKIICSFDRDLAIELTEQASEMAEDELLPVDVLTRFAYPIVYVHAPDVLGKEIDGFFYWIFHDRDKTIILLYFAGQNSDENMPIALFVKPGWSLKESIEYLYKKQAKMLKRYWADSLKKAIQLVLYLNAVNSDIRETNTVYKKAKQKQNVKQSKGNVRVLAVGAEIGSVIRKSRKTTRYIYDDALGKNGTPKRPHYRRAHFHRYWTGPKNGKQEVDIKWIGGMYIHKNDIGDGEGCPVIHPVMD